MNKKMSTLIFILSGIALIVSAKLFINMAIFSDEFNTSPDVICGGEFWLSMDWMRLGILLVICIISGINMLSSNKKRA